MLLMAPRRTTAGGSMADMHSLLINPPESDQGSDLNASTSTSNSAASSPTSIRDMAFLKMLADMENLFPRSDQLSVITNPTSGIGKSFVQLQCCIPNENCLHVNSRDFGLINLDDPSDCIRVICTNENCTQGQYMHRDCFNLWEQTIMNRLSIFGPPASWPKLFKDQTIWAQENYPTIFRMCQCKCGGFLRRDLEWNSSSNLFALPKNKRASIDEVDSNNNDMTTAAKSNGKKSKNKNSRKSQKCVLNMSTLNQSAGYHQNFPSLGGSTSIINTSSPLKDGYSNFWMKSPASKDGDDSLLDSRSGSVLSSDLSLSPIHNSSSSSSSTSFNNSNLNGVVKNGVLVKQQQSVNKSKTEIYSDRIRAGSGCNGIFSRRIDFSSFNVMPNTRLNSYQVKIEDEGNHGNDETRLFILSSLASQQKSRVACVLCEEPMLVFDRYPLVDGAFFLSPKRHAHGCIEVKYEGRVQYLTSVCLNCLHGVSADHLIRCRFCSQKWDGSNLVLGTMYSYDIFAAMPCCSERLKCNNCFKLLLHPMERLNFYSDYSHMVSCPYCNVQDTHFVKPIAFCYSKQASMNFSQIP